MGYLRNHIPVVLAVLAALILAAGCSTSGNSRKVTSSASDADMTLGDFLHRINGVQITGSGDYAKVHIRGARSISNLNHGMGSSSGNNSGKNINFNDNNDKQPLFIVDGQKVGRDYPSIRDMFAPGEIKSVKLLKPSQASRYGSQGGSGVIVITTKKSENKKSDNNSTN